MMRAVALVAALAWSCATSAEQSRAVGDYTIHYNAFASDFLTAEVARKFGVTRSRSRALVNVSVTTTGANGLPEGKESVVTGTVRNLAGQTQEIQFKAAREGRAFYYLGEFRVAGEDTYRIELSVTPPGAAKAEKILFTQALVGE